MENYQKLKEVIQASNPEIMERKECDCNWCGMRKHNGGGGHYIIGRPIRLADVLLTATDDKTPMFYYENLISKWNLKDDNLDHQSEETKQFLIDLLIK